MLRTKGEQRAYLDGYEMCAECVEKYLSDEGKQKLECLLIAVRNAVEIEDIEPQKSEEQEKVDDYRDILDELEREEYYESKYGKEQETWNGIHGQVTAPKGTFEKIFNDNDTEDDGI